MSQFAAALSPATPAQRLPQGVAGVDVAVLREVAKRVLWLSTAIVDSANRGRPNPTGVKVGGHQASSASMVDIMVALWFGALTSEDRVSVKPHASPVLHAINYLLGDLDAAYLTTLREKGGLQSYPSRLKDPGTVDFSTGSVGIGATATLWAALAHRYVTTHFRDAPRSGRFIGLLGDAELDEGAIWEAIADPASSKLGELLWVVDLNRQSLDRVVPDIQIGRLQGMFEAAGWQVVTLKWGRLIGEIFERRGGDELRRRLERMPNEEYQRMLRVDPAQIAERILADGASEQLRGLVAGLRPAVLAAAVRDLGGHDLGLLLDTFAAVDDHRPTVVFAYTIKGRGLATEGHPNNHSALLTEPQMRALAAATGASLADPWRGFDADSEAARLCARRGEALRRDPVAPVGWMRIPEALGHQHRKPVSTQAALGRLLADLVRDAPEVASRVVTCSPDVASSTNLGGWINKTGVWTTAERRDWFADDAERVLKWSETAAGQHIELGIAEVNLVGLLGELGATWSRWGQRLIPSPRSTTRSWPEPSNPGPTESMRADSRSSWGHPPVSPWPPKVAPTSPSRLLPSGLSSRAAWPGSRRSPPTSSGPSCTRWGTSASPVVRRRTSGCPRGPSIPLWRGYPTTPASSNGDAATPSREATG
ncbi:hypothetical protein GCM10010199_03190 [Dactylosporangium roseum]